MAPVSQGQKAVAAAMKLQAARNKEGQQAKKPEGNPAKGAAAKKKKAGQGVVKDKGAKQYYDDGHGEGFEGQGEDGIHEVDPNVVNGRLPEKRPRMQPVFPPVFDSRTDDDEEDEKDRLEDPTCRGSTRGSTGLQSGQSHVSRGGENGPAEEVEEDPYPARSGSLRPSELAKSSLVSCII